MKLITRSTVRIPIRSFVKSDFTNDMHDSVNQIRNLEQGMEFAYVTVVSFFYIDYQHSDAQADVRNSIG